MNEKRERDSDIPSISLGNNVSTDASTDADDTFVQAGAPKMDVGVCYINAEKHYFPADLKTEQEIRDYFKEDFPGVSNSRLTKTEEGANIWAADQTAGTKG